MSVSDRTGRRSPNCHSKWRKTSKNGANPKKKKLAISGWQMDLVEFSALIIKKFTKAVAH
jgi:hypothetical protein